MIIHINDYKIINAFKLSSSRVWAHFATDHTTHNRASYAVCKMCYDSKDKDGTVCANNHTHYELVYGSTRITSKLANHSMLCHRAIYDADNETKVNTFIASGGTMENHVVSEKFMSLDTCP